MAIATKTTMSSARTNQMAGVMAHLNVTGVRLLFGVGRGWRRFNLDARRATESTTASVKSARARLVASERPKRASMSHLPS
jgi:hypothetical protein